MAVNVADLVVKMSVDATQVVTSLTDMQRLLNRSEEEMRRSGRATNELSDRLARTGDEAVQTATSLRLVTSAVMLLSNAIGGLIQGLVVSAIHEFAESWRRAAEETKKFNEAVRSVELGKIDAEITRLTQKLEDLAEAQRKARGPAGAPTVFPEPGSIPTTDMPALELGSAMPSAADAKIAETLRQLQQLREQRKGAAMGADEIAAYKELDKLLKENLLADFKATEEAAKEARAGWVAYAEAVFAATEKEQLALVAAQDQAKTAEERLVQQGIRSDVAAAEATIKITEDEQRAIVDIQKKTKEEEDRLIQQGIKDQVAAAEATINETEREQLALVEIQDEALRKHEAFMEETFGGINQTIAASFGAIASGTQSIEKAFLTMGQNIASQLVQSGIIKALKLIEEAAKDLLDTLIKSGLIKQIVGFAAGLVSFVAPTASPSTPGGGTFAPGGGGGGQFGGITQGLTFAGEAGPEAIVPLPNGRSIPVQLSGGGGGVVVNIMNQAPGTTVERRSVTNDAGRQIHDIVVRVIGETMATGEIDRALAVNYGLTRKPVGR